MITRTMTDAERERGWYVLACGCHVHVTSARVANEHPHLTIEYCPIADMFGVRREELEQGPSRAHRSADMMDGD